jgi:lipopolysaccharide transport protein LptA
MSKTLPTKLASVAADVRRRIPGSWPPCAPKLASRLSTLLAGLALAWLPHSRPAAAAEPAAKPEVDIRADNAEFDLQNRTAIYCGNVQAKDPQMRLSCQVLTAQWSEANRITSIVAEERVELEVTDAQGATRATGAKAVYTAETDSVELTGEPKLVNRLGTLAADRVVLQRAKGKLTATGNVRMVMPAEALKETGLSAPQKPAPSQKPR